MNKHNLINKVNFNSQKKSYVYLSYSSHGQYKIGNTIHPKKRMTQISDGSFWKHQIIAKVYVDGLVPRLENTVLDSMEEKGFKRNGEMFLIHKKTKAQVKEIFETIVRDNINQMRREVRAKTRNESKILSKHGIKNTVVYTSIARA